MSAIQTVRAGPCSTIQDLGRFNLGRFGIVRSGAVDAYSARLANLLVGNPITSAVIESTCIGDTIQFPANSLIAITGGLAQSRLVTTDQQELELPTHRPVLLPKGGTIRIGTILVGWRTYLAVAGGLDVQPLLGSRSTYLRAGFGGWQGRALKSGDSIPVGNRDAKNKSVQSKLAADASSSSNWFAPRWKTPSYLTYDRDAVILDLIPSQPVTRFESGCDFSFAEYAITQDSDRMGYRFAGPEIRLLERVEPPSEGLLPGTVQLPPDGQPILLLNDAAPTGGYPILGHVPQADLPQVAQLRPGQRVRWRWATPEVALEKLFALNSRFRMLALHLQLWLESPQRPTSSR